MSVCHSLSSCFSVIEDEFQDKSEHYLLHNWTFYVWKSDLVKNWPECLHEQLTIKTIEEFWAVYHRVVPPSLLNIGIFYKHLMECILVKFFTTKC